MKQRGELKEPKRRNILAKRKSRRSYGVRKPKDDDRVERGGSNGSRYLGCSDLFLGWY